MEKVVVVLLSAILTGAIYAAVALTYVLVIRASGLLNLTHGEVLTVAALLTYTLRVNYGMSIWLALAAAVAVGAVIGAGTYRLFIVHMRDKSLPKAIILTFGLALVIQACVRLLWGTEVRGQATFPGVPTTLQLEFASAQVSGQIIYVVLLAFASYYLLRRTITGTTFGLSVRAVGSDPEIAEAFGRPTKRLLTVSFASSAALAAMIGWAISPVIFFSFETGTLLGIKGLIAAIVGNIQRPTGAIVGGFVLGAIEAFTRGYISADWITAASVVALLAVLLLRPQGMVLAGRE